MRKSALSVTSRGLRTCSVVTQEIFYTVRLALKGCIVDYQLIFAVFPKAVYLLYR